MSQVKNLRAMFENKGDDPSPPDRGRSPAGFASGSGGSATESPRLLSTVRTNFVAIQEKDGRMGLRRNPSHESTSPSRRPTSTDMETESLSTTAADDIPKASRRLFVNESIPEPSSSSEPTTRESHSSNKMMGAVNDEPSHNPDKNMDQQQPGPALTPAEPTQQAAREDSTPASMPPSAELKTRTKQSEILGTGTTATARGGQISTVTRPMPKGSTKTSANTKAATTTNKRTDTKPSSKPQPTKKDAKPTTHPSTANRKPAPVRIPADQGTGFVKPKPKSPTKPVALPSSFTAPTASSVSKGGNAKSSTTRQTGGLQPPTAARAPSRASAAGSSGARTLRKQPSTINSASSSRPSIGPPPKKPGHDNHSTLKKKESHVDEGFLARMMRPTQSSSFKTTEKAPATPPRKSGPGGSTSTADSSSRRASSVKRQAVLKGPAENTVISSNVSETEPSVAAEDHDEKSYGSTDTFAAQGQDLAADNSELSGTASREDNGAEIPVSELEHDNANNNIDDNSTTIVQNPLVDPASESVPLHEAAAEAAQVETAEEVTGIAQEAQFLVQKPTELIGVSEKDDSEPGATQPARESATIQTISSEQSFAGSQTPTQVLEETTGRRSPTMEETGPTQTELDKEQEAVMDQMIPPEDVIPEETAAVETAEEVAVLADAGNLVQTPVTPQSSLKEEGARDTAEPAGSQEK